MGKKTRILFDSRYVARGGAEIFMSNVIDYLPREQYDITIAAVYWDKKDPNEVLPPDVHFIQRYHRRKHYKKWTPLWFLDAIWGRVYDALISAYISFLNFDIAISTQEKQTMHRTDMIRAKRKFAWVHTDYSTRLDHNKSSIFHTPEEERQCMARFEKVVCVSRTTMNSVIATVGDPGNLCVRYNPINVNRILELSTIPCQIVHNNDKPLIVSVGRLVSEKNYMLLLETCKLLMDSIAFDVWIIGDGEERPVLEDYIRDNNLTFVKLLGTQINPFHYIKQADLFVSASITEGYGLAVQEALVLGVPVAAVNTPGIAESLDARFGMLSDASPDEFASIIRSMLSPETNKEYRTRISEEYHLTDLYENRLKAICSLWDSHISN